MRLIHVPMTRLEIDQRNPNHAVAFLCGMGGIRREFEDYGAE
jgi:hypothetical protein